MMGTGNALMLVEPFVDNEPFVVAYPDDIVLGEKPLSKQLIETWEKTGNTVLAVKQMQEDHLSRYGVIEPENSDKIMKVKKMVEKPKQGTAPSRFASFGRYLYTSDIFDALKTSDKNLSHRGEFTQTEAINHLASNGMVSALEFEGTRYDLGEPFGFLTSALQIGLMRPEFKKPLLDEMRRLIVLHDNADNR